MELRVKELRDEKGWNQTVLGYHSNLSPSQISLIETGKRNPSAATLKRIATALGVEIWDLFPIAPKARTPLRFNEATEAGSQSLTDLPQDKFLLTLSSAVSEEALFNIYYKIDAERTHLELAYRQDEANRTARSAFARAVDRRMVVLLTLVERGVRPHDPEKESLAEQLQHALEDISAIDTIAVTPATTSLTEKRS